METIYDFLQNLHQKGVQLKDDNGTLKIKTASGQPLSSELRLKIKEKKAQILEAINQMQGFASDYSIPKADRSQPIPLSYAQQRLWLENKINSNKSIYNMLQAVYLNGELDVNALQQAINGVISRQEGLRTIFVEEEGTPYQQVLPELVLKLKIKDLQNYTKIEQQTQIDNCIQKELSHHFDLELGPLIKIKLFQTGEKQHLLIMNSHHIISDEWSDEVLLKELAYRYGALRNGQTSELPPINIQYADYANWQRTYLDENKLEDFLGYWTNKLSGVPLLLDLPLDHPRKPTPSHRGSRIKFDLSADLSAKISDFSKQEQTSLFMTMLSAYFVLLSRYCDQRDLLVGTPIANRQHAASEELIGFFSNFLAMRSNLSDNPTFTTLVKRVKADVLEAQNHQDLPFEKLIDAIQPNRDLGQSPVCQAVFSFNNLNNKVLEFPGLEIEPYQFENTSAKYDLILVMESSAGILQGEWTFNTDLFDSSTIERMARDFVSLLHGLMEVPHERVLTSKMLKESEIDELLHGMNNASREAMPLTAVHHLIEKQAETQPHKVAITFKDESISYLELNQRANRLGHLLIEKGVKPNDLVAVSFEPGIDMIVAALAVLKAQGAYLPLDPHIPAQRREFILEDAEVSLFLATSLFSETSQQNIEVLLMEEIKASLQALPTQNPKEKTALSQLGYVIYTSGSTGKPKGVPVNHNEISQLFVSCQLHYGFDTNDVWSLFHSFAFDFSVWEIFGALVHGGRLVIVPTETKRSTPDFYQLISKEKVTVLSQTPSAFYEFIQSDQENPLPLALRYVVFGGEALHFSRLKPWFNVHGDQKPVLVNMYGITETTVFSTFRKVSLKDISDHKSVIGRPLPGVKIHILDEHLQPVPTGVRGEIYISGGGVTAGYLNRPDQTEKRFLDNPYHLNMDHHRVLYKSGDLARYQIDGDIEYIGRVDHQVQVRGHRIEIGEIENALSHLTSLESNAVIAKAEENSATLIAFLVFRKEERIQISEIREHLKRHLPAYMIPDAFVCVDQIPLTHNGKADREHLLKLHSEAGDQEEISLPANEIESALVRIWQQLLDKDTVSTNDQFFIIGGHSLKALRMLAAIQKTFGLSLNIQDIFTYPTITELSNLIQKNWGKEEMAIPVLPEQASYPLSHTQKRFWLSEKLGERNDANNITGTYLFDEAPDLNLYEQVIKELIQRHSSLRTTFTTVNGEPKQVIQPVAQASAIIKYFDIQNEQNQNKELDKLYQASARQPFELEKGPLIRLSLIQHLSNKHYFIFTVHHIIADGWSLEILAAEFMKIYRSLTRKEDMDLQPIVAKYADFAVWQNKYLKSERGQQALVYWKEKLPTKATELELPYDFLRAASKKNIGRKYSFKVPVRMDSFTLQNGQPVTEYTLLLTCIKTLLYRYSNQNEITIGSPFSGRTHSTLQPLVGAFINTVALYDRVDKSLTFNDFLQQVNQTVQEAHQHQDYPFDMVLEGLKLRTSPGRNPLFDVGFTFHNEVQPEDYHDTAFSTDLMIDEAGIENAVTDLWFHATNQGENFSMSIIYDTALFQESSIITMASDLIAIIESIYKDPEQTLNEIALVADSIPKDFSISIDIDI